MEDAPTSQQSQPQEMDLGHSAGADRDMTEPVSADVTMLSEAARRDGNDDENTLKSEASTMPSQAAATAEPFSPPMETSATEALTASLNNGQSNEDEYTSQREGTPDDSMPSEQVSAPASTDETVAAGEPSVGKEAPVESEIPDTDQRPETSIPHEAPSTEGVSVCETSESRDLPSQPGDQTTATETKDESKQASEKESFEFWSKPAKGKKGKKKGKKSRPSAGDLGTEEERSGEVTPFEASESKVTESALPEQLTSISAEPKQEEEDDWAGFSTKRSKRKAKKSASKAPAVAPEASTNPVSEPAQSDQDQSQDVEDGVTSQEKGPNTDIEVPSGEPMDVDRPTQVSESNAISRTEASRGSVEQSVDSTEPDSAAPEQPSSAILPSHSGDAGETQLPPSVPEDRDIVMGDEPQTPKDTAEATENPLPEDSAEDWLTEAPAEVSKSGEGISSDQTTAVEDEQLHSSTVGESANSAAIANVEHDTDFSATVARGLADSGFSPDLVANDPVFQRRASPPGAVAEANPEEVFQSPSQKRKKSKRGKASSAFADIEGADDQPSGSTLPPPAQGTTADDFNDTLSKTLAGSGFDSALLQQAATSSNDVSSNDLAGDSHDVSHATSKRKKGKKGKKSNAQSWTTGTEVDTQGSEIERGLELNEDSNAFEPRAMEDIRPTDEQPEWPSSTSEVRTTENMDRAPVTAEDSDVGGNYTRKELDRPDQPMDSTLEDVGPIAAVAAGGVAALGIGAALGRSHSSHHDGSARSPRHHSSERSLGLLPGDRSPQHAIVPSWSFDNLGDEGTKSPEHSSLEYKEHAAIRDSGYAQRQSGESSGRDLPELHSALSRESLHSRRSGEPLNISTDAASTWNMDVPKTRDTNATERNAETSHGRSLSRENANTPLESTTKNRASYLFQTTPENVMEAAQRSEIRPSSALPSTGTSETSNVFRAGPRAITPETKESTLGASTAFSERAALSSPSPGSKSPLGTILEEHHGQKKTIADRDVREPASTDTARAAQHERPTTPLPPVTIPSGSGRAVSSPLSTDELINRMPWPAVDDAKGIVNPDRSLKQKSSRQTAADWRSPSAMSNRSNSSANQFRSPEDVRSNSRISNRSSSSTLRRVSMSGDLRAASKRGEAGSAVGSRSSPKTIPFEPPPTPPSNDDEVIDAGASRSVDMSDVYQGYGDAQASQTSPTRPPNMRQRQSMHIMDLESKLDRLVAENEALQNARQLGTRGLSDPGDTNGQSLEEAISARDLQLREKDNEISQIRTMLQPLQDELTRLTEINDGLTESNRNLVDDTNGRYATLQQEHAHAHEQWQNVSRELGNMQQENDRLHSGSREAAEAEVASALADKNSEIMHLREELDVANERIRALQMQIQSTRGRDFLNIRDEDYFDGSCQKLCQHVQQWVLRFSKLSDNRICRLSTEVKDEKVEARLDNSILDGSDVDKLLRDRIKRRDVFMSVVMTMVWEFVFTRYLFGMDREQRQKLKALEKILAEVGPPRAVSQWRATTLTLLAKRPAFAEQRDLDTQAVANEVFGLLCALLPPPSNAETQLLTSLQKVIGIAVDLSIEMRCQRAEYIMLPPLQPEYDTNGDLVRQVHFNASLMNERSGTFGSNQELEESHGVVKIVLFPLVVKKGDEVGEGDEEIVVCPAQVLVQNENGRGKRIVRVQSGAMEIDDPRRSRDSLVSPGTSTAFGGHSSLA